MAKSEVWDVKSSTVCKAFDAIWGKLRDRKVTSAPQERVVCVVLGYFFLNTV